MRRLVPGLALLAVAMLVMGPGAGPTRAQADRAGPPPDVPVVVDAANRVVGRLGHDGALVAIRVRGHVVSVQVTPDRIRTFGTVGYESEGCQGPAFLISVAPPGALLFHSETRIGPGQILLGTGGPAETRRIVSVFDVDEAPPCQTVVPELQVVFPATPLLDLNAFTPPFRVR